MPDIYRPSFIWKAGTVACALIAAGSLAVSIVFVASENRDDERQREATEEIIQARTEARKVSCEKDRKFAVAHNNLVIGIVTRDFTRPVPAELEEGVRRQLVPVPDCTPEGIARCYGGQGCGEAPEVTAGETSVPVPFKDNP